MTMKILHFFLVSLCSRLNFTEASNYGAVSTLTASNLYIIKDHCGQFNMSVPGQPWNVYIWIKARRAGEAIEHVKHCTGVLISDRHVLTTASCLIHQVDSELDIWEENPSAANFIVGYAEWNEGANCSAPKEVVYTEVRRSIHEKYRYDTAEQRENNVYDIAITELNWVIVLSQIEDRKQVPVCMPPDDFIGMMVHADVGGSQFMVSSFARSTYLLLGTSSDTETNIKNVCTMTVAASCREEQVVARLPPESPPNSLSCVSPAPPSDVFVNGSPVVYRMMIQPDLPLDQQRVLLGGILRRGKAEQANEDRAVVVPITAEIMNDFINYHTWLTNLFGD